MANPTADRRLGDDNDEPSFSDMQTLLRKARYYVYHYECANESEYDEQQAILKEIDDLAPPPAEIAPEPCEKDADCIHGKGHQGNCDDIPF